MKNKTKIKLINLYLYAAGDFMIPTLYVFYKVEINPDEWTSIGFIFVGILIANVLIIMFGLPMIKIEPEPIPPLLKKCKSKEYKELEELLFKNAKIQKYEAEVESNLEEEGIFGRLAFRPEHFTTLLTIHLMRVTDFSMDKVERGIDIYCKEKDAWDEKANLKPIQFGYMQLICVDKMNDELDFWIHQNTPQDTYSFHLYAVMTLDDGKCYIRDTKDSYYIQKALYLQKEFRKLTDGILEDIPKTEMNK